MHVFLFHLNDEMLIGWKRLKFNYLLMHRSVEEGGGRGGGGGGLFGLPLPLENSNFLNFYSKVTENIPQTPPPPPEKFSGSAHDNINTNIFLTNSKHFSLDASLSHKLTEKPPTMIHSKVAYMY